MNTRKIYRLIGVHVCLRNFGTFLFCFGRGGAISNQELYQKDTKGISSMYKRDEYKNMMPSSSHP